VEYGVVFGRVVENVWDSPRFYSASEGVIIGFGAAAGKYNLPWLGSYKLCYKGTCLFYGGAQVSACSMDGGGIPRSPEIRKYFRLYLGV
jgi:hypothetical protein